MGATADMPPAVRAGTSRHPWQRLYYALNHVERAPGIRWLLPISEKVILLVAIGSSLNRLSLLLDSVSAESRIANYLSAMCTDFGWSVAEYWRRSDGVFGIAHESHVDTEALNRFAREARLS